VISSINPLAKMYTCVNGVVPDPLTLLGSAQGAGAADWGVLDEHRKLIDAVEKAAQLRAQQEQAAAQAATKACKDTTCTDPTHQHDHHDHGHQHGAHDKKHSAAAHAADCHDAACTDSSHDHAHSAHSHGHDRAHTAAHTDDCHSTTCTDPTHDHSHGAHTHGHAHAHVHDDDCHSTTCTDPTHDHSHGAHAHDHGHSHSHRNADMTTAEDRFGITSFVYRRRRPFHPVRFSMFLQSLGNLSVKGVAEMGVPAVTSNTTTTAVAGAAVSEGKEAEALTRAKRALLRSKGFVWMATSAQAAYFMSHAGQYLELLVLGRWWAAIDQAEWPKEVLSEVTVDFEGANGDRRQEVVFIGQFAKDGGTSQRALEGVLDECLLTPEEMVEYEKVAKNGDDALRSHFAPGY
jgi:G3E family GTPase